MGCWLIWFVTTNKRVERKVWRVPNKMTGTLGKQPKTKAYLLKTKGPTKYFVTQPFWTPKLEQSPRTKQQSLKDQSVLRDLPPTLHLSTQSHVHCQILFSVWGDLSRTGPSVWFSVSLLCNPPWEVCVVPHISQSDAFFVFLVLFCHLHSYFIVSQWIFVSRLIFVHYKL